MLKARGNGDSQNGGSKPIIEIRLMRAWCMNLIVTDGVYHFILFLSI